MDSQSLIVLAAVSLLAMTGIGHDLCLHRPQDTTKPLTNNDKTVAIQKLEAAKVAAAVMERTPIRREKQYDEMKNVGKLPERIMR